MKWFPFDGSHWEVQTSPIGTLDGRYGQWAVWVMRAGRPAVDCSRVRRTCSQAVARYSLQDRPVQRHALGQTADGEKDRRFAALVRHRPPPIPTPSRFPALASERCRDQSVTLAVVLKQRPRSIPPVSISAQM
ncbi:hypothetical protein BV20DRAFT_742356 [Pilatotrama ljubarskyi]|nr:hypothetical protein BV20DRAFT_742356 [Pilatotrama ljubarskyi]